MIRKPRPQLSDSAITVSTPISLSTTTPTTSTTTATNSSRPLELLAVSPTRRTTTKSLHITEQRNLIELGQKRSDSITGQKFSTSPKSIPSPPSHPVGDEQVITIGRRSSRPTSSCSSPPTTGAKTPPLPQFTVVSEERKETAKLSPKHLWLNTREEGNLRQPERPPVIAFSPEKLCPTLQKRPGLITQALFGERKGQPVQTPALQGDVQRTMPRIIPETTSAKEVFDARPESQFPAGIPKMPGLIDLNLLKARAESKVEPKGWIPKRTVAETLLPSPLERDILFDQQPSMDKITLKSLLLQSLDSDEKSESRPQGQTDSSLQSLQQLTQRLAPKKAPTTATHHPQPTQLDLRGPSIRSTLQRPNTWDQFRSQSLVRPEDQFRPRVMKVTEPKRLKLSLSSGLSSPASYDEDEEDRPLVIDTEESRKKTDSLNGKGFQLGRNPAEQHHTPLPTFHVTPLAEVKQEQPWLYEGINSVHDQSYLTPMEDDDLDDLDSLDRVLAPSQSGRKRGNDPKPPEKVECPYCKRFYGKYYIKKHMVDQHP